MTRILITYGWVRSSYAVLRNLSSHNFDVHVADSFKTGMSQFSLKKKSFDLYPSHYINEDMFIEAIQSICLKHKIDIIFPSHNETEILARNSKSLSGSLAVLLPNADHCSLFNNKAKTYEYVDALGIPVPVRVRYSHPSHLASILSKQAVNRTVIKLLTGNSGKGVFYANSPNEAQSIVINLINQYNLEPDRFPLVEERVDGEGWGSSVLYWNGRRIAGFTHRRIREKISTGGTSTLREAGSHPSLEKATDAIFSSLGWHGLAMAEFKVCPETGKYWFIEVNPRLWGSLPLAISAGVEFPYLALLCATKGPEAAITWQNDHPVKLNWRSRWVLGDCLVSITDLIGLRPIKALNNLYFDRADALDDFFMDDPGVFLGEISRYLINSISTLSLNGAEKGMIG